jgi:hypothetical protein
MAVFPWLVGGVAVKFNEYVSIHVTCQRGERGERQSAVGRLPPRTTAKQSHLTDHVGLKCSTRKQTLKSSLEICNLVPKVPFSHKYKKNDEDLENANGEDRHQRTLV